MSPKLKYYYFQYILRIIDIFNKDIWRLLNAFIAHVYGLL